MKKNAMLKIAAILMVAVLLTTCAISSTFAKYVTSGEASAKARVAKWGVEVDAKAEGAFLKTYGTTLVIADEAVVAPGTSVGIVGNNEDNAIRIAISGTPEVATKVNCNNKEQDLFIDFTGNWEVTVKDAEGNESTSDYCPIVFVINNTPVKFVDTIENFETALQTAIAGVFSDSYTANKPINEVLTIDWYWNFPETANATTDAMDTQLGDRAATAAADQIPGFTFNFDITIEQNGPASADQ